MVQLADIGITRCKECGKLVQLNTDERLCEACRLAHEGKGDGGVPEGRPSVDHLNAHIRVHTEHMLDELGIETPINAPEPTPPFCIQCNKNPAIEGVDYCLACHLGMHYALSEAAKEVLLRNEAGILAEEEAKHHPKHQSVAQALDAKLARTPTSRVNPSQEHKFK